MTRYTLFLQIERDDRDPEDPERLLKVASLHDDENLEAVTNSYESVLKWLARQGFPAQELDS